MSLIFNTKKYFSFLLVCFYFNSANAQYKIVKLESEDMFIRFFYKTDTSDEIKNDTTYFLCIRKRKDTVCIEKFVDNIKVWEHLYTLVRAKKKLPIKRKKGKKIELIYEPFYVARLVLR